MSECPDLVNTNIGLMMLKPEIVAEVLTFLANFLTSRWAVSSTKMCVFLDGLRSGLHQVEGAGYLLPQLWLIYQDLKNKWLPNNTSSHLSSPEPCVCQLSCRSSSLLEIYAYLWRFYIIDWHTLRQMCQMSFFLRPLILRANKGKKRT